jgi:hypothetical protein
MNFFHLFLDSGFCYENYHIKLCEVGCSLLFFVLFIQTTLQIYQEKSVNNFYVLFCFPNFLDILSINRRPDILEMRAIRVSTQKVSNSNTFLLICLFVCLFVCLFFQHFLSPLNVLYFFNFF